MSDEKPNLPVPAVGQSITSSETAANAVAAQSKALVEARFLMAMHKPRSWLGVRTRLLEACKRPGFAETAMYSKPVGREKVTGPSIRFVEEALRACTNVLAESTVVYDDDEKRIVRVTVTDLEANLSYPQDVVISKTIERRSPQAGAEVIRARTNSRGDQVYIIRATDDDMVIKQAALVSKAIRTAGLRCLPSDIVEEAIEQVQITVRDRDTEDPQASRKRIADSFYAMGVMPEDLEKFLAHPLSQTTPAELTQLRHIYQALKDGEATWAGVMDQKTGAAAKPEGDPAPVSRTGTAGMRDALNIGKPGRVADALVPNKKEESEEDIAAQDRETARLDKQREDENTKGKR